MSKQKSLPTATLILAGGLATRLQSVAGDTPKSLMRVAGRPFIEWQFDQLRDNGLNDIVLCVGHGAGKIKDHIGDGSKWNIAIRYSHENKPLGTAGAIRHAQGMLGTDPFFVLNGDSFVSFTASEVLRFHRGKQAALTLVLAEVEDAARFGSVAINENGEILNFDEKGKSGKGLINAGVYLITQDVLHSIPESRAVSIEKEVFPRFVGSGLYGMVTAGPFIDIGTPESLQSADRFFFGNEDSKT